MDGQWSNPVSAEVNGKGQVIFPGGDGWLYAFEATTGKLIWKFDCNPKKSDYQPGKGTRNYFLATPVVYENKVYVGVGRDRRMTGPASAICGAWTSPGRGDLSPVNDNFDPKAEVNKNSGLVWHFGGPAPEGSRAASTCSAGPSAPAPSTTAWSTSPTWTASCTAWTRRRGRSTGTTT